MALTDRDKRTLRTGGIIVGVLLVGFLLSKLLGGGGAIVSDTAPQGVPDGSIWWNSAEGPSAAKRLYVKYFDGDSSQWVAAVQ